MSRRKGPAIPNELPDRLPAGGDAGTALAQGGLLDALKKAPTERASNAEMDHHLAGDDGAGNSRNGYGRKTVMTDTDKLALDVPRDRQASCDPQLIAKYQRRFPGFDERIVSMYARGMSTREITGHPHDLYGIDVSPDLISTVAAYLVHDAWRDLYDVAVVLAQDTDLCEALRIVRREIGKEVGLVWLDGSRPGKMTNDASFVRHVMHARLTAAQFPDQMVGANGEAFNKPAAW